MLLSLSDDSTLREKQLSTEALRIPPGGLLPLAVTRLTQVPPAERMPRLSLPCPRAVGLQREQGPLCAAASSGGPGCCHSTA